MNRLLTLPLYCLSLFLFAAAGAYAQSPLYPVSLTVQATPPHTGTLSSWAQPGTNRLGAILLLRDGFENSYQTRLKIRIEGNGIVLRTQPNMLPRPITLNYGVPLQLTAADFAAYLDVDNLEFVSGITRQQYLEAGTLPEGLYTLCVQVFDYDRASEQPLSLEMCSAILHQPLNPPVVVLPGAMQSTSTPQTFPIQWQPRHAANFNTRYTVALYQNIPNLPPLQVINQSQAYVSKTVNVAVTSLITPTDPPLTPGQSYVLRVRAEDPLGRYGFANDGWSEPVVFQYGSPCDAVPGNLRATYPAAGEAQVQWDPRAGQTDTWEIRIRANLPNSSFYTYTSAVPSYTFTDLTVGMGYLVEVRTRCASGALSPQPATLTLAVPAPATPEFDCNFDTTIALPTNRQNIPVLNPGDVVQIGGFPMTILSAMPSAQTRVAQTGGWEGLGQVRVPWMGGALNVRFLSLYVNTDKVVYDGFALANTLPMNQILDSLRLPPPAYEPLTEDFCHNPLLNTPPAAYWYSLAPNPNGMTNPGSQEFYLPYVPGVTNPTVRPPNPFDRYNPGNPLAPYDPYDYNDPNNPYTAQNYFDPYNPYNPYNYYNPYDPFNYDDPANPYTAANPYNPANVAQLGQNAMLSGGLPGNNGSHLTNLTGLGGFDLPRFVGPDGTFKIGIYNMRFGVRGAAVDCYLRATQHDVHYVFRATNVKCHPGGLLGAPKLYLVDDVHKDMDKMRLTIRGHGQTFVSVSCDFQVSFGIGAKLTFCPDVLRAVEPATGLPKPLTNNITWQGSNYQSYNYVTGSFSGSVMNLSDFVGAVNIDPFTRNGLDGWVFTVQEAVMDFSDLRTPSSLNFPVDYTHPDLGSRLAPSASPLWQGVTIKRVQVNLPAKFPVKSPTQPPASSTGESSSGVQPLPEAATAGAPPPTAPPPVGSGLAFGATNIVIDERGVTGDFFARNLLPIEYGSVGSWGASIDSIGVGILVNQPRYGYISGKLKVGPIADTIGYYAMIAPGNSYVFSVRLLSNKEYFVPSLYARAKLKANTEIGIMYSELSDNVDGFLKIYGEMMFYPRVEPESRPASGATTTAPAANAYVEPPESETDVVRVPYIRVDGLHLSTKAPYVINGGAWQFSSGDETQRPRVSRFNLEIKNVGMLSNTAVNKVAIVIAAKVSLTSAAENGFAADGAIRIICDVREDPATRRQQWTYDRTALDSLVIDAAGPGFKVKGSMAFFQQNPVYGTGFQALVKLDIPSLKMKADAAGMFGRVGTYSYFFFDAYASWPAGIAIGSSGLFLYGAGGGVSYHMNRAVPVNEMTPVFNAQRPVTGTVSLGRSFDGTQYLPQATAGLGVKLRVGVGTVRKELFNADLVFEILFNTNWGVERVSLRGDGQYLTPPPTPPATTSNPAIRLVVDMSYFLPIETFDATLDLFVNLNGGVLTGAYANNRAGRGIIHSAPGEWYFWLGTPQKRMMVMYSLAALEKMKQSAQQQNQTPPPAPNSESVPPSASEALAAWMSSHNEYAIDKSKSGLLFNGYLNAGTVLPPFPGVPPEVLHALQFGNLEPISTQAASTGTGVLFGAGFKAQLANLNALIFYATMEIGAGFDVMLLDYGNAYCAGSSPPLGIDGWYATGQLYAYATGSVGISVKVMGKRRRLPILTIAAGAVLQTKLPNPLWAKGYVGGRYSVLAGMIKGQCRFDFEVGKQCTIVGEPPLADLEMIASTSPASTNSNEVDVFIRPQVTFNIPIGHVFSIEEDNVTKFYRAHVDTFEVYNWQNQRVPGAQRWNAANDVIAMTPEDILAGEKEHKLIVSVSFEVSPDGLASWQQLLYENQPFRQRKVVTFTTGQAPDHIPPHNVAYSYPARNMANFLKGQHPTGYVQLIQGQPDLFAGQPECKLVAGQWQQKVLFLHGANTAGESALTYNRAEKRVSFVIPQSLPNGTVMRLLLANEPLVQAAAVDANVVTNMRSLVAGTNSPAEDSAAVVRERLVVGQQVELQRKELLSQHLRTSIYNTLAQKLDAMRPGTPWVSSEYFFDPQQSGLSMVIFGTRFTGPELFDRTDLQGVTEGDYVVKPLVNSHAVLSQTGNNWYANAVFPNMYSFLPNAQVPMMQSRPDTLPLGLIPHRGDAVRLFHYPSIPNALESADITSGTYSSTADFFDVSYRVPYYMKLDEWNYHNEIFSLVAAGVAVTPAMESFLNWNMPHPYNGTYQTQIRYALPGQNPGGAAQVVSLQLTGQGN